MFPVFYPDGHKKSTRQDIKSLVGNEEPYVTEVISEIRNSPIKSGRQFDWSDYDIVTVAKTQGLNRTCWAFAICAYMESKILKYAKEKKLLNYDLSLDLSEQQLISKATDCKGVNGGSPDGFSHWKDKGPILEGDIGLFDIYTFPGYKAAEVEEKLYEQLPFRVKTDLENKAIIYNPGISHINAFLSASEYNDIDPIMLIKHILLKEGPLYLSYKLYMDFYSYWYCGDDDDREVYIQQYGSDLGGHAVLLIGWDDNKKAWLCKNCWGSHGGPNGNGKFFLYYYDKEFPDPDPGNKQRHRNNLAMEIAWCHIEKV